MKGKMTKRGLAFVIVLIFVLTLTLGAGAFILLSSNEIRMAKRQNNSTRAFYIAEAGLERGRYDLGEDADWTDGEINGFSYDKTDLDADNFYLLIYDTTTRTAFGGEFIVRLKDIAGSEDEIWARSKGIYNGATRIVQAKIKSPRRFGSPDGVTSAIETEGDIDIHGSAEVDGEMREGINTTLGFLASSGDVTIQVADTTNFKAGDRIVIDNGTAQEEEGKISSIDEVSSSITLEEELSYDHGAGTSIDRILSFEDIFGVDKAEMESIAQSYYPDTYYDGVFNNNTAAGVTWVSAPGTESQITENTWAGSGILIVDGDMKITGGTFNGVIWVIGALSVSGNPEINGGIFVESGLDVDTSVTGTANIYYDSDQISDAFYQLTSLPPALELWQEVFE